MEDVFPVPKFDPINWYYYPSIRLSVTQNETWPFRSALYYFELYLNGLILQWNRLGEENVAYLQFMHKDLMKDVQAAKVFHQLHDRIDLDMQFYLICWDKIHKYSSVIAKNTTNKEIEKIAHGIENFTEKGTLARHYNEHLDRAVQESREGFPRSQMFSGDALFFKYVDVSTKGAKIERELLIARADMVKIMETYESILSSLGANVSGYKMQQD